MVSTCTDRTGLRRFSFASALLTAWAATVSAVPANYDQPLDRPFTLRNPKPLVLEDEYARQLREGAPMTFIFPRPCQAENDSSAACGGPHGATFSHPGGGRGISFSPQAGYEYRRLGENVNAFEIGLLSTGRAGPVSFHLDTRMFTELHENFDHSSYDREFLEKQDQDASGSLAYTSYSRFRAHASYDVPWGRFTAGKDAVHWGPGLYHNLVFSRDAIPFRHLTFSTSIGPFSVMSLYGSLLTGRNWEGDMSHASRSIYAHRYEWRMGGDWLLGISEQLVLHDAEAPFAFLPMIPLFIAKAEEKEALNNGNIAADLCWRFLDRFRLYSEFFIDDMQSPTSLFDDSWGNKWAWMAGGQWIWSRGPLQGGMVAEYSRLEPWVYTHYKANTSQTAHFDYPLGNQVGPNSQTLTAKAWAAGMSGLTYSCRVDWRWKGADPGSGINDEFYSTGLTRKVFLEGIDSPAFSATPSITWQWRKYSLGAWLEIGEATTGSASILYRY